MEQGTGTKWWTKYQEGLNFMRQDGIMNNSKVNELMYAGIQWFHVSKANQLPKITINFFKRSCNFLISAIMGGEVKINYTVDPYLEDDEETTEKYSQAEDLFNRYSETAFEEVKQSFLNEQMIKDSLLAGLGLIHYFWDDSEESGNGVKIKGKIKAEIVDAINFFPADPTLVSVQDQEMNQITYRDSISNIKKEAKDNKISKEKIAMITPDSDTEDQVFEKAQKEVQGSEKATVLLTYFKKNGTIWFEKSVKNVIFKKETDTKHKLYPIIYMNGELRKRSIYGTSPFTEIVPNQIYVNTLYAMAMVSAQRTAYPKAIYDKTKISGVSNGVGGAIGVQGDINSAFTYSNTGQISFDVYNLVDNVVSKTKESVGANDALLGNVKPENTSALLVNQQQANVPLESIERRFYNSQEDAGLILCEFWQHNFVVDRPVRVKGKDGKDVIIKFNGAEYADIKMSTRIDIGASSQWSEVISINTMNEWVAAKEMTFLEMLERFPKQIVPKLNEMIESRKEAQELQEQQLVEQANNPEVPIEEEQPLETQLTEEQLEQVAQWLELQPPEVQEQVLSLPPEQQEEAVLQLMQQQEVA